MGDSPKKVQQERLAAALSEREVSKDGHDVSADMSPMTPHWAPFLCYTEFQMGKVSFMGYTSELSATCSPKLNKEQ